MAAGGNYVASCCLGSCGSPCCVPLCLHHHNRTAIKTKLGITDTMSLPLELLAMCCCGSCMIAQELREVAHASTGASKEMNVFESIAMRVPDAKSAQEAIPHIIKVATETMNKVSKATPAAAATSDAADSASKE